MALTNCSQHSSLAPNSYPFWQFHVACYKELRTVRTLQPIIPGNDLNDSNDTPIICHWEHPSHKSYFLRKYILTFPPTRKENSVVQQFTNENAIGVCACFLLLFYFFLTLPFAFCIFLCRKLD